MTGRGLHIAVLCGTVAMLPLPALAQAGGFEAAMSGWWASVQQTLGGLGVKTRQENTSSAQQATVSSEVELASAESFHDVDRRVAVHEAMQRYESMQTANAGLCGDVVATKESEQAKQVNADITGNLGDAETNWNREGGSRIATLVQSQQLRAGPFCPPGEAALGLCDDDASKYVGGYPAADTDPAAFMLSGSYGARSYGTTEAEFGMIYTDTVLPMPTMKSKDDASAAGVSGLTDRADARHQQAIISMGRKALADVILRGIEGGIVEDGE